MVKLKSKQRKVIPTSKFAVPGKRAYPIEDRSHAKAALSMVSRYGSPEEKKQVRGAVKRKYGI
jgi:hypothetical protein